MIGKAKKKKNLHSNSGLQSQLQGAQRSALLEPSRKSRQKRREPFPLFFAGGTCSSIMVKMSG